MKVFLIITALLTSLGVNATITPNVTLPENFDENKFSLKEITDKSPISYNRINSSSCSGIKFKDYYFLSSDIDDSGKNIPGKLPFNQWLCLNSSDIYYDAYMPSLNEKIVYSHKNKSWVKIKNSSKDISPPYLKTPYDPIQLFNINSVNAKGYAVISRNILSDEQALGIKKMIYFCLIRDTAALCGSGVLNMGFKDKEVDLTPYALKSLESVEMGIDNPFILK